MILFWKFPDHSDMHVTLETYHAYIASFRTELKLNSGFHGPTNLWRNKRYLARASDLRRIQDAFIKIALIHIKYTCQSSVIYSNKNLQVNCLVLVTLIFFLCFRSRSTISSDHQQSDHQGPVFNWWELVRARDSKHVVLSGLLIQSPLAKRKVSHESK